MIMKVCSKCGETFPMTIQYFYISKTIKCGFISCCKKCKKEWQDNNFEKIQAYHVKYAKENVEIIRERQRIQTIKGKDKRTQYVKDNKEKFQKYNIEYGKKYYKLHHIERREKELIRLRKFRKDNKIKIALYGKKYRKENSDKINILTNKHRALKKALISTLTVNQWEQVKTYFDNKCCYCGEKLPLEQEHWIAATNGGNYTSNNILCACRKCNASKNNKDFFQWFKTYEYYSNDREVKILKFLRT